MFHRVGLAVVIVSIASSCSLLGPIFAQAQNSTFIEGFLAFLQANGHSQLANLTTSIKDTQVGQALLADLPNGNLTLFAPTDQARKSTS